MYGIIKPVIERKDYELTSILKKINTLWAENEISNEQREELIILARENADPKNSYAPLQEQIEKLASDVNVLKAEVNILKNGGTAGEPAEEYPEYVQPTGGHDAYKVGDKITYKGKKYECLNEGCVWSPDDYPQGWREVTEQEVLTETE